MKNWTAFKPRTGNRLFLLLATVTLLWCGCNRKSSDKEVSMSRTNGQSEQPPNENAVIARFKSEIKTTSQWIEEQAKARSHDPSAGRVMIGETAEKLKTVNTDGLPADLKAGWQEFTAVITEIAELFRELPKPNPANPNETGKKMQSFLPRLIAVQGKLGPVARQLQQLGKRYDIDFSRVIPGNGMRFSPHGSPAPRPRVTP